MATTKFEPQAQDDPNKVRVAPRDLIGALLVIKVKEVKADLKTKFAPQGKTGIAIDVASVTSGNSAPDQLWFNPAITDALAPYVGATVAVKLAYRVSGSTGYRYIAVEPVTEQEQAKADAFLDSHPELFTPATTGLEQDAPAESVGHW